jgi:hypothetical protein
MKYLVRNLLKLVVIYSILTMLAEIVFENSIMYQSSLVLGIPYDCVNATFSAISNSIDKVRTNSWKELILIDFSLWIFNNRVYYLVLLLVILVSYYSFKDKNLKRPSIFEISNTKLDDY